MGTCPHPEKRIYQYRDAADMAAKAMSAIFGQRMSAYGCPCGRFHLKKGSSSKKPERRSPEARRRRRKNWRTNRRARDRAMKKPKYKFLYRAGSLYYWQNTAMVDSRVEQYYCNVPWFWGTLPGYARIEGKLLLLPGLHKPKRDLVYGPSDVRENVSWAVYLACTVEEYAEYESDFCELSSEGN